MTHSYRNMLQALSHLIDYPDAALLAAARTSRDDLTGAADQIGNADLRPFFAYLRHTPLIDIQAAYTAAFDLNPDTCLLLAFHLRNDDRQRSAILADLAGAYAAADYAPAPGHTPDYLPLMLEFTAALPLPATVSMMRQCLPAVERITLRLERLGNPWAAPFRLICALLEKLCPILEKDAP